MGYRRAFWSKSKVKHCDNFKAFNAKHTELTHRLMKQGFKYDKLCRKFKEFARKHNHLIKKFHVSVHKHIKQGISFPEIVQETGKKCTIKDLEPIILDSQGQASGCHFIYIYFFLGIPLFFYQIVQFCTFIIFYFPEYIFFYSPFFTTQFFLGFSTVFFLLFFCCGYLCLVCVNVNNRG